MDLQAPLDWSPPALWGRVTVIDSHSGGEPFRVVVGDVPVIPGGSMIERRRHARENLDELRRALMWEPRGHADMYGGFVGPPVDPGSDLSVLFLHNEGFSTMCGHGIIALTKVAIDTGILPSTEPETVIRIDTPA
ncbi:MAG TPA: proline racemase family protein, partial [Acidimicrobiia bacterium]